MTEKNTLQRPPLEKKSLKIIRLYVDRYNESMTLHRDCATYPPLRNLQESERHFSSNPLETVGFRSMGNRWWSVGAKRKFEKVGGFFAVSGRMFFIVW